jgi:predicted PurR-regulated permease PerM
MARKSSEGAIIILIVGAILGVLWQVIKFFISLFSQYSADQEEKKKIETERVNKFADRVIDTSLGLFERNKDIIEKHLKRISTSSSNYRYYYIDNMTRDCINDICLAEGNHKNRPNNS